MESAARLAKLHLDTSELSRRWLHVQGVARRANELSGTVDEPDRPVLVAAAWLHDIGYAPDLIKTGMHSIDGALYLKDLDYPERIVALVAHHTGARYEAAERGLIKELDRFPREESAVADALAAADLTTSPDGMPITVQDRIDEILNRYPEHSSVYRAISRARPALVEQTVRVVNQ